MYYIIIIIVGLQRNLTIPIAVRAVGVDSTLAYVLTL